jgi:pyrroline-5-carboxylate reductase
VIVGFAGSGNMAAAMARGWAAGEGGPERMLFTDAVSEKAQALAAEVAGEALDSTAELAERADLVLLAVKPAALETVAAEAQAASSVLSILGATPLVAVATAFPGANVMRTIPNLAVEVRRGVLGFTAAPDADEKLVGEVKGALEVLGRVVELEDELFDVATAVMSCSPAYLALAIGSLAEAGGAEGLDPNLAHSLVVDTAAGTAELLRRRDPADVRRAVASPGGSTEAGLAALEEQGVADAFAQAVSASLARMRE